MEIILDWEKGKIDFEKYSRDTRFDIPRNLTKKEYTELVKEINVKIKNLKDIVRHEPDRIFSKLDLEDYIIKKEKINKILKFHQGFKKEIIDIQKAKEYPIDNLLDFKNGFVKCLYHDEDTPSMHHDKERNKAHCFAGCGSFDSIDIYMKINNVTFTQAVKGLTK